MNNSSTILLIEDNIEMSYNIEEILKLAHYQVVTAYNGKAGVEKAYECKPDLILCDIMMPELDGYGVMHILSKAPETTNIPFIFLTAKAESSHFRTGMNMGADDYITKPFDGLDLLKVVEIRLKKNEYLKSSFEKGTAMLASLEEKNRQFKLLQKLLEGSPNRIYKKKEFIYMEGQYPNSLYFVQNGDVKTYRSSREGKEFITSFYTSGDLFGYASLLNNTSYLESAVCQSESVEISIVDTHKFMHQIQSNSELSFQIIRLLSRSLANADDRMLELAYQSVRQRVASALLKINKSPDDKEEIITMSRKDVSCMVGTATESLNRTLLEFKEEGLIEIRDDGIKILNKQKLQRIFL